MASNALQSASMAVRCFHGWSWLVKVADGILIKEADYRRFIKPLVRTYILIGLALVNIGIHPPNVEHFDFHDSQDSLVSHLRLNAFDCVPSSLSSFFNLLFLGCH